jgi:FAD:protein FMN transferase
MSPAGKVRVASFCHDDSHSPQLRRPRPRDRPAARADHRDGVCQRCGRRRVRLARGDHVRRLDDGRHDRSPHRDVNARDRVDLDRLDLDLLLDLLLDVDAVSSRQRFERLGPRNHGRLMSEVATASWRAIGTGVRLVVHDGELALARAAVERVLEDVDRTYSRFRDDSELVRLNARAGETVAVSSLLAEAISVGLIAAQRTGGAVDPTVGRAMRAIGYDRDFAAIAANNGPIELHLEPIPGWQAVDLSLVRREVRLRPGVELDLGSTGKGLAADLAAAAALASLNGDGGVLVSLGGDVATAGRVPEGGWRILVAEDSETPVDADGEVVAILDGAIATSSTTVRRWQRGERTLHHLVDPRTGGPVVSPWRSATVSASTCVLANTAATATIVLGDAGADWLAANGYPARLTAADGSVVRLNGWPSPPVTAAPRT